jgi:hypothetical protein
MPDIELSEVEGVVVTPWFDPATSERPSRINPNQWHEHRRFLGEIHRNIAAVFVRVDGSTDYDDPPFSAWLAEAPGPNYHWPTVISDGNRQRFVPRLAGHYTLVVRHDGGGSITIHFDVE